MWLSSLLVVIGVACAVVCVVALLRLRAVLITPFPPLIVRRLPDDFPPPTATADLYEKAVAELAALGFSSPQWVVIAPEKETPGAFAVIAAVFCHVEKNALALLQPPLDLTTPNDLASHFITRLADDRKLTSQVGNVYAEAVADDKHPAQTIFGATLAEQWAQHQQWVEGFNTPVAAGFGALETLSEELQEMRGVDVRLVNAGKLWRDAQGVARPTLAFALRILRLYRAHPKAKANKITVPLARQVMFATFNEHWQKRSLPIRWYWALLTTWLVLFAVLGVALLGLGLTSILVMLGVFILHLGSHYLAARVLGCQHQQTSMIPFLGCDAADIERKPGAARRAWMAMMGPLPGIALGWTLLGFVDFNGLGAGTSSTVVLTAAIYLLVLNYFALLPARPLDGAPIVQAILPPRWLIARTAFIMIVCIAGIVTAIHFALYPLIVFALALFLWIPSLLANDQIVRLLAANPSFPNAAPDQQRRLALEALQQRYGETTNAWRRLRQAQAAITTLAQARISRKHKIALATVYLSLLCLPLIFWGVATMEAASERVFSLSQINPEKLKQTQQRVFLSLEGMKAPQLLARIPAPDPPKPSGGWFARLRKPVPPPLPDPADPEQIVAAQKRLKITFPDDYRELLSLHDGYPPLQLLPVAQVRRLSLSEINFFFDEGRLQESRSFFSFAFPPSSFKEADMAAAPGQRSWHNEELQRCVAIGGGTNASDPSDQKDTVPAETPPTLLWCSDPAFEQARIVSLEESLWAPDFTTYLRYKATQRIAARELANRSEAP